jgi:hypothetical protein
VRGYWQQQVGYGEGESWLTADHPEKFFGGRAQWRGRVYSPLPFVRSISGHRVNSGVWGTAEFPSIYRTDAHAIAFLPHLARWQLLSFGLLLASLLAFATSHVRTALVLLAVGVLGLTATAFRCAAFALLSDIAGLANVPRAGPTWSRVIYRATIAWLHAIQPLARAYGRVRGAQSPPERVLGIPRQPHRARGSSGRHMWVAWRLLLGRSIQRQFWNERWFDRAFLLGTLTERLRTSGVARAIEIDDGWRSDHDIRVVAGRWTALDLRGLVEDHGAGRCLFRVDMRLRASAFATVVAPGAAIMVAAVCAALALRIGAASMTAIGLMALVWSVRRLGRTVAGVQSAIESVVSEIGMVPIRHAAVQPPEAHLLLTAGRVAPNVEFHSKAELDRIGPLRSMKASGGLKAGGSPKSPRRTSRSAGSDR